MTLKDLAIDHDYYAHDSNYYSNEAGGVYDTWKEFYEEFKDADVDLNLVYRWDIKKRDDVESYYMQIVIIGQRKGIYAPWRIDNVFEEDVPEILEYLRPHLEKLISIWQPLSAELAKPTEQP